MSTALDMVIARGFNLQPNQIGNNYVGAKNNRQQIDSNVAAQDKRTEVNEFNLNQAQDAIRKQQVVGNSIAELIGMPPQAPEVLQGQQRVLENTNNLENIRPELRGQAAEMLMRPTNEAKKAAMMQRIMANSPEAQNLQLQNMLTPAPVTEPLSSLGKMISDLDRLPPGHPARPGLEKAIAEYKSGGVTVNAGTPPSYTVMEIADANGNPQKVMVNKSDPSDIQKVGDVATGVLSGVQKQSINGKLQLLKVAQSQLKAIKDKFYGVRRPDGSYEGGIQDSFSAGVGGNLFKTQAGEAFDAAVDGLRITFRSLTRTPGEGSMSDSEGELAQAPLPNRGDYESTIDQKIQQIESLVNLLDSGYSGMLNEGSEPEVQQSSEAVTVQYGDLPE